MSRGTQHADPERGWTDDALRASGHRATTDAEWQEYGPEADALPGDRIAELVVAARLARRPLPKAVDIGDVMASVLDRADALAPWAAAIAEGAASSPNKPAKVWRWQYLQGADGRPVRQLVQVDASSATSSPVAVWRWHHLGGAEGRPVRLLAEREVDGWILDAWRASPVAGWLGPDGVIAPYERLSESRGLGGVPLEWRRWIGRRREPRAWRVPEGSTKALTELAELARSLAWRFSWEPAEATAFVLCGAVPAVQPIRGRVELRAATSAAERAGVRPRGLEGRTVDGFARVVVELDPTLTPDELSAWWREVRRQLEPGDGWPAHGEARNELGRWLATAGEGSWSELHGRWNETHAGHEVAGRRNFARLARTAVRRLLSLGVG